MNNSKTLDELISNQQSYNDKTSLVYKEKFEKKPSPSMKIKED